MIGREGFRKWQHKWQHCIATCLFQKETELNGGGRGDAETRAFLHPERAARRQYPMIILVFIMISMVAIPMAVEKVRSPEDNLANDVKEEFAETIIRPLEDKVDEIRTIAMASVESAITENLLARL
jgi:hypothetical protein